MPFRTEQTQDNTGKSMKRMKSYVLTRLIRADGVYMGFPFIAAYGAVTNNQTLLQFAYDNCRLYRDALLVDGPTGKLWAHIYDDDTKSFDDAGLWATGTVPFCPANILLTQRIDCCICFRQWMGSAGTNSCLHDN